MSVLTETTVLARTRAQDLKSVRRLNCWGSELNDVSIVRRMPNVEILSLSVNTISTLEDFHHCKSLQELYLRKNSVTDLNEIHFLQELPKLHSLWLADNPCAEAENYRLTVLKALPNLKKLDNVAVHPGEVEAAKTQGLPIQNPREAIRTVAPSNKLHSSPPDSGVGKQNQTDFDVQHVGNEKAVTSTVSEKVTVHTSISPVPSRGSSQESPKEDSVTTLYPLEQVSLQPVIDNHHASGETSFVQHHAFHARVQTMVSHSTRSQKNLSCDNRCNPSEDHQTVNGAVAYPEEDTQSVTAEICEQSPDGFQHIPSNCGDSQKLSLDTVKVHSSREIYSGDSRSSSCPPSRGSPARVLSKGGKNRNANILSAVLCLIKELDYASLEVAETAIHCRMEEFEDD